VKMSAKENITKVPSPKETYQATKRGKIERRSRAKRGYSSKKVRERGSTKKKGEF